MLEKKIEDLKIRIDLLQDKIWTNEDRIGRHIELIAKLDSEVHKLKTNTKKSQEKLSSLEKEIIKIKPKEVQNG